MNGPCNPPPLPFTDSRRLTGSNLYFVATGAVLELTGAAADAALTDGWRQRVAQAAAQLSWPAPRCVVRPHAGGAALALSAPCDQLYTATEVNEWALCATLLARDGARWSGLQAALLAAAMADAADPASVIPPVLDAPSALQRLQRLAAAEQRPALRALLSAAAARSLPQLLDDDTLTLGAGAGGASFPLTALPEVGAVRWSELRDIPTAVVTGSNGKTTTVRLLAACARARGWQVAYNCTDGVYLDGEVLASGDYSGPAGTRRVLREPRATAAILETARGGILRRGIAVSQAAVAVVTNISADHFGEYGIDDLDGLADAKLTVAALVLRDGLLVLNADDPLLRTKAGGLAQRFGSAPRLAWFAQDADHPFLSAARERGVATCGVRDGRLCLRHRGRDHDLGAVAAMPLAVGGYASYNVANLAAAALAAAALDIAPATIVAVCARFGTSPEDNPGRLMRYDAGGVQVLVDYAHNPDGLRGLLRVAESLRAGTDTLGGAAGAGTGRLGLLLGHAGNRQQADLEALAAVAAGFKPALVVIKENEAHLRGREPGEVPRLLRAALLRLGMTETALRMCASEIEAARYALDWARPGDVLALPVHAAAARAAVLALLAARSAC